PEAKTSPPKPVEPAPQIVEEPPDLSSVKRPDEVVLVGRIARPRLLADTLTKWSSLPVGFEDMILAQAKPLSRAILWEAPVEMLGALDAREPLYVGSVGFKSLDAALSAADAMQLP